MTPAADKRFSAPAYRWSVLLAMVLSGLMSFLVTEIFPDLRKNFDFNTEILFSFFISTVIPTVSSYAGSFTYSLFSPPVSPDRATFPRITIAAAALTGTIVGLSFQPDINVYFVPLLVVFSGGVPSYVLALFAAESPRRKTSSHIYGLPQDQNLKFLGKSSDGRFSSHAYFWSTLATLIYPVFLGMLTFYLIDTLLDEPEGEYFGFAVTGFIAVGQFISSVIGSLMYLQFSPLVNFDRAVLPLLCIATISLSSFSLGASVYLRSDARVGYLFTLSFIGFIPAVCGALLPSVVPRRRVRRVPHCSVDPLPNSRLP